MEERKKKFRESYNEKLEAQEQPSYIDNRIGDKKGQLTVIEYVGTGILNTSEIYHLWRVQCECGNKVILNPQLIQTMVDCGCGSYE